MNSDSRLGLEFVTHSNLCHYDFMKVGSLSQFKNHYFDSNAVKNLDEDLQAA